ncbi:MAG: hypothetical protein ACJAWW_002646 [Sulfurimonas sp.]|jgi:hypothetical protein
MIELVFNSFEKYGVVGVLVVVGFTVIVNLKNIIPFIDGYKKRRMHLLKEVASDENVDEQIKEHIQDEIESEYFKLAHGIKVEKLKAICILNTHNKLGSKVPFRSYLNANYYIFVEDGGMKIKISRSDRLHHYYNVFTASAFFIFSPIVAAIATTIHKPLDVFFGYIFAIVMMSISIWIFATTRNYKSATIIEKELLRIDSDAS